MSIVLFKLKLIKIDLLPFFWPVAGSSLLKFIFNDMKQ